MPAAAKPTLKLEDLRKIVAPSSPQISPDGSHVALLVPKRDFTKDETTYTLVLVDTHSHAIRSLIRDAHVSNPSWSPDGRFIAFTEVTGTDKDKATQLFVLPMDGGEALQLTHEKKGVEDYQWRPDGRALAYVAGGEAPNAKAIEAHDDAFDVTYEAWTAQAAPVADVLYEVTSSGGTPRRIPHWSQNVAGGFTYSADGRSLFVTRSKPNAHPNRYLAHEIVRVDVRSGAISSIDALSTTQEGPVRSPDGRHIAYGFANPKGTMQSEVALADANGKHPQFLTKHLDRNADILDFASNDAVLMVANDGTNRRFYRVSADGSVAIAPIGNLAGFEASVAKDGTIAFTANAPDRPTELYLLAPHATQPVRLTHYNDWIDRYAVASSSTIMWKSTDGFSPDGVLVRPPNWHKGMRAPLVLFIHGGPTSASNTAFSSFPQVLAAHGWFVFEPNYRGSDNLGLAFARTTVPHIASVPGQDIEDGLAAVLKSGSRRSLAHRRLRLVRRRLDDVVAHRSRHALESGGLGRGRQRLDRLLRHDRCEGLYAAVHRPIPMDRSVADEHVQCRVAADVCRQRENADAHPQRRRRLPRPNAACLRVLSRRTGDRNDGAVRHLPRERPLPKRPGSFGRRLPALGSVGSKVSLIYAKHCRRFVDASRRRIRAQENPPCSTPPS